MKSQNYRSLFFLLLIAALVLQSCAQSALPQTGQTGSSSQPVEANNSEQNHSQTKAKLKVVTQPFITFAPFYIAEKEGYFTEQGLGVQLLNIEVSQNVLPALSSGQADVASGLISAGILNSIQKGAKIRIVADKGYTNPKTCDNYALAIRRDLVDQIKTPADLKGRSIVIVPATWLEYYMAKLLAAGGLTLKDIQPMDMPVSTELQAFDQKKMDMVVNSEPWITRFKGVGHGVMTPTPSQLLPDAEVGILMYGPTLLGQNQDVGKRFMIAYLKAVQEYNQGKTDRNLQLVSEFTGLDRQTLQNMCWPAIRSDGKLNAQSLTDFQKWAVQAGYQPSEMTQDQFIDTSFVDLANQSLAQSK